MPSPRQILIDIKELGLDPRIAHRSIGASGHLRNNQVPSKDLSVTNSAVELTPNCVEEVVLPIVENASNDAEQEHLHAVDLDNLIEKDNEVHVTKKTKKAGFRKLNSNFDSDD